MSVKSIFKVAAIGSTIAATVFSSAPALARQATVDSTQAKADEKRDLPLAPGRWIEYTADAGSWISLDVSPDGKTVVFDLLGDLYLVPMEGGKADTLTSGMAFDSQPRFSPDGTKVLFISDRNGSENVWTIEVDTKHTEALSTSKTERYESPEWSPDGRYIVASKADARFGAGKLWMRHVDSGSGAQLISEPANLRTIGAAFSPDGRYIWYAQRTSDWQYNAQMPQFQVAQYDRETGKTYVRTARESSAFRPTLSPDGKWLVYGTRFESETGLIIRDLATGDEHWLAYPVQHDDIESRATRDALPGMSFTPDSREVVASYGGKIWRIPIDGTDPVEVVFSAPVHMPLGPELSFDYPISDAATFTAREVRDAVPSPDGAKLAFSVLDRLYVMDWPDGTPRRLTTATETEAEPVWSPDGRWIAYVTWDGSAGTISRVPSSGSGPVQRLTRITGIYRDPAWSPDGARIVAIRGPARAYRESIGPLADNAAEELVWIPSAGGVATRIAPTDDRSQPHFTADPDRIYLFSDDNGLVSIRWDGTDEKEHLKVTGNTRPGSKTPNNASIIRMAPVGDRALARVNDDVYVVTVPKLGSTPTISVADPATAAFPARKLTDIGGFFPEWSSDGSTVHFSMGPSHFTFDLAEAQRLDEVIAAEKKAKEAEEKANKAREAEEKAKKAEEDSGEEQDDGSDDTDDTQEEDVAETKPYKPFERRITIEIGRDIPEAETLYRGARIVTMNGDEVIERGEILVRNNRIVSVGPAGSAVPGPGVRIVECDGLTALPGFVDTHAHMFTAWEIHKAVAWPYLANLAYGVTTTRDPQTQLTDVLTYGDLVESGAMLGPRIYSTGPGIFGDFVKDPVRDLDHARDIMTRYSRYFDTKTVKMYMTGNRQQRQWIIMAAREQEIMPTTEGGLDFKYNLTLMQDGYPGLEHSLPVYPFFDDVVKLAATSGVTYTPTLLVQYGGPWAENWFYERENAHDNVKLRRFTPHEELDTKARRRAAGWFADDEYSFHRVAEGARRILDSGGHIGIGSHGQLQGLGYHWEMWALASGGMRNHDVLRAATLMGAQAIGLDQDLGSLEAGKLADIVMMEGDPLANIRDTERLRYVVRNGRLYDADSLDEVWPGSRKQTLPDWGTPDVKAGAGGR